MSLFTRLFEKYTTSTHSQPISTNSLSSSIPTKPPHRLFTITEILQHIFSYIDDSTLTRIIVLVSRQWLHLAYPRVQRPLYWDHRWRINNLKQALTLLPGAGRFSVCVPDATNDDESRQLILKALKGLDETVMMGLERRKGRGKQKGMAMFFSPLRELEIQISFAQLRGRDNVNTLPLPASLRVLKVQLSNYHGSPVDLGRILKECPLLETLHIRVFDYTSVKGSTISPLSSKAAPLPLRSFILSGTQFDQSCLELLLAAVDPQLFKELKLINLNDTHPRYTMSRLLTSLAPFHFSAFHFSAHDNLQTLDDIRQKMIDLCPEATEWSLRPYDIHPTILQELESLPNVITTLELPRPYSHHQESCVSNTSVQNNPSILHRYLCTSPHLIHLKNIHLNAMQFEGMDIHRRSPFGDLDRWSQYRYTNTPGTSLDAITPGIWACRGLESLHINLHGHEEHGLRSPVHSRIVFGYISIVCPNLTDLQLTVSSECRKRNTVHTKNMSLVYFTDFCMRLEGGFCLLSRLKYLITFRLDAYSISRKSGCWPVDLNWIVAEGNKPQNREKRRKVVAGWNEKLGIEKSLEKERLLTGARYANVLSLENGDYNGEEEGGLAGQLKNLGLLSEVKAVVEEMDQDGYRCFPVLDRVSFSWAIAQRPADALAYLFPGGKPR
ncbi:hypothetical protein BKA57DRAFT_445937 [Linnemannia elongata]|nr:hypothetical protein BKA57DRAFT_445937 [Linnemannia elongata]